MGAIKRDAADRWFSDCIRHRDGYACCCCGRSFGGLQQGLEACHIYGRANKSTRWDADNAVALCSSCHRRFTAHPLDFSAFLASHLGTGHLEILQEKKNRILKTNRALRLEIAKHYREEYRRMVDNNVRNLANWA